MSTRIGSTAQRLLELPYEKRVCRIEHYPHCLDTNRRTRSEIQDRSVFDLMELEVNAIADAGTEVWAITGTRGRGIPLWPSRMLPMPSDVDPALIPHFLDLAHQKGIIVLSYYPFIFTAQLADQHPEWMIQMLDDGEVEVWNEGWFCWNSPYRDWLPAYLIEMLDHLDFDGIYFDDMNWGAHSDTGQRRAGGCCCVYCQERYRQETGRQLPSTVDMNAADFKQYVIWRYDKFREAVAYVAQRIHEKHPHAILDWNYYGRPYGIPDTGWKTAHPLNRLDNQGTYFFMETGLDNLGISFPVKLLRACGHTFGVWLWATQILPEVASHSAPYPEPHTAMLYGLQAVANGGASITTCLDAGEHSFYGDALKSVFHALKQVRPYVGGESLKYLALHVSQQTRDFAYSESADEFWQLMRGSNELLKRSQILTDIVFDQQLTEKDLSPYSVLFLSNSKCLSEGQVDAIRRFIAGGGTLIATHETSLYDELGQRHDNFSLADVLGVDLAAPPAGDGTIQDIGVDNVISTQSNIYIPQDRRLSSAFGHFVAFGAKQSSITLRDGSRAQVLCTKSLLAWGEQPPLNSFQPGVNHDSRAPAVTLNTFGKGKAIYICGDVGCGHDRRPPSQLRRFVAHLIRSASPAPIEVGAPRAIEVAAFRRSETEFVIHLFNDQVPYVPWSTSANDRRTYFYLDDVLPVHDIPITLHGLRATRAFLPLQGKELVLSGQTPAFTVPQVNLHEVVIVEIA